MDFQSLLDESVRVHGHLCPGQVLGVRMSMLGLGMIGIGDPKGRDRKKIIVYVEMDRCATDAVQSVTGCSLGKRSMKFMDYGKMAATFHNIETKKSVRVVAREEARDIAKTSFSGIADKYAAQLEAYKVMPTDELFETRDVSITIRPEDMPGRPIGRVQCAICGEHVQDMREVMVEGKPYCRPCAYGGYYQAAGGLCAPIVMQSSHNGDGMQIRSKLWIEVGDEPVFGRGRMLLLGAIDKYGSMNQAAKEINISYRKAWGYVGAMEERLGIRLVERKAGGRAGGGAVLTPEAHEFLRKYARLDEGVREAVDRKFREAFLRR